VISGSPAAPHSAENHGTSRVLHASFWVSARVPKKWSSNLKDLWCQVLYIAQDYLINRIVRHLRITHPSLPTQVPGGIHSNAIPASPAMFPAAEATPSKQWFLGFLSGHCTARSLHVFLGGFMRAQPRVSTWHLTRRSRPIISDESSVLHAAVVIAAVMAWPAAGPHRCPRLHSLSTLRWSLAPPGT